MLAQHTPCFLKWFLSTSQYARVHPQGYKLDPCDNESVYQDEQVCYVLKRNETILYMGMALVTKRIMKETNLIRL